MEDLGVITRQGDVYEARLEREFEHGPQEIWAELTDPEKLPQWLAPGSIELKVGGRARLDFVDSGIVIDSEVTACEPLRVLEYAWSKPGDAVRPVRWELEPGAETTKLSLILGLPAGEDVARSCAGWEAHLEMLAAALEGVPIKFPFERFKATREAYKAQVA
ncbi:MAG TPA: SRPBCC family protein [Caulobacteraceae bacterium]|nr:SRPBCC family protein [Caulobacteraceae bacterium]